jgi:hypothetical protein
MNICRDFPILIEIRQKLRPHYINKTHPASAEVQENVGLYIHSPIRLHEVVLN